MSELSRLRGAAAEAVSKQEIRAGDDLGAVGAVREPPKIRALLEAPLP